MTRPEYGVFIDWDNDNDFDDIAENITDRTLARTPISIQYGRDQARALSPTSPGRAVLELDNRSGDYSPENSSSPLVDLLGPGRPMHVLATHLGTEYVLFHGFLDDYDMEPGIGQQSVSLTMLDLLGRLSDVRLSTALHFGLTTGDAINIILDAAGWDIDKREIDQGATLLRYWWEEGSDALTAIKRLVAAEGPPALVTVTEHDHFMFRDRHHRLTIDESLVSQATFRGGDTEPMISPPLIYNLGWRDIVNSVTLEVQERTAEGELSDVWSSSATYTMATGETVEVIARTSDPFLGAITPVATLNEEDPGDYTILSGPGVVTVALSNTAGAVTTIRITSSGGPAVITDLKFRAYSVSVSRTYQIHVEDPSSIAKHGLRSYPDDIPLVGIHDALAVAQLIIAHRAERLPVVSMRITAANDTRITQQLSRDLSDRVTIIDNETGLNADFFIETIQHRTDGMFHDTTFGCEKARDANFNVNVFRFDTVGSGFDDGVFESVGLMDPDFMFRFDTAGQGFNDGRLAY